MKLALQENERRARKYMRAVVGGENFGNINGAGETSMNDAEKTRADDSGDSNGGLRKRRGEECAVNKTETDENNAKDESSPKDENNANNNAKSTTVPPSISFTSMKKWQIALLQKARRAEVEVKKYEGMRSDIDGMRRIQPWDKGGELDKVITEGEVKALQMMTRKVSRRRASGAREEKEGKKDGINDNDSEFERLTRSAFGSNERNSGALDNRNNQRVLSDGSTTYQDLYNALDAKKQKREEASKKHLEQLKQLKEEARDSAACLVDLFHVSVSGRTGKDL
jgi:hypothetical protein